ncbi:hypothetical protein F4809DRAFT_246896 [Biscogniauxia mediterranea]|nr:hypothetical protein F4809DRAFT_246896 [Biscogniauxia mediterranea]
MATPNQPDNDVHDSLIMPKSEQDDGSPVETPFEKEVARLKDRETRDILRVQRVNFEMHHGDAMVVIKFPDLEFADCNGEEWVTKKFFMSSSKLLGTGSSVFKQLLSDASQKQIIRRLGLGDDLTCRYVLDLTPPTEGEESAAMLIQASLSSAVRAWWLSSERLNISPSLVSGHDDHCSNHMDVPLHAEKVVTGVPPKLPAGITDLDRIKPSHARDIDDFCPIRLRANIIRLLMAISGAELVLNSAPRVYTLACVASSLDCIDVVRDEVTVWLLAQPKFIDINAEDALQISWMLQISDVARASFRVIVAERALAILGAVDAEQVTKKKKEEEQPFGRPRAAVTEDQATCIQYAAQKFADRVQSTFSKLMSDDVFDWLGISEWRKLKLIGYRIETTLNNDFPSLRNSPLEPEYVPTGLLHDAKNALKSVQDTLLRFMHGVIQDALDLRLSHTTLESLDRNRAYYIGSSQFISTAEIYSKLALVQRLMVPAFWDHLRNILREPMIIERILDKDTVQLNTSVAMVFRPKAILTGGDDDLTLSLEALEKQLRDATATLCSEWAFPSLEVELGHTKHLILGLSDEEFKFLPLWADGLDDGTGGVYESNVPDAELGPIGPGPSFRTGGTVATDVSSITQSTPTISAPGTVTMTIGRSLAAVRSDSGNTVAESEHQAINGRSASSSGQADTPSPTGSVILYDEDSDYYRDEENDDDADDPWEDLGSWSVTSDNELDG